MEYSVGQSFPVGMHIAQYFGDFWDLAVDASVGWAGAADASAGWVGMANVAVGWGGMGACVMASASLVLTMASQFHCANPGWYPTLTFLGLQSLSL